MPTNDDLLQKDELTQERTPEELAYWVNETFRRLEASENIKCRARLREGLVKQFVEEVQPLSIFVNRVYSGQSNIICIPVIGNQNYDAIIRDTSCEPPTEMKVEITGTSFDHDYHLRMEHLNEHGGVFLTSKVERTGTRRDGKTTVITPIAVDHNERLEKQFRLIKESALRKLSKHYEGRPLLIITFDEFNGFFGEQSSDVKALSDFISTELTPLPLGKKFRSIHVLGLSGRVLSSVPVDTQGLQAGAEHSAAPMRAGRPGLEMSSCCIH